MRAPRSEALAAASGKRRSRLPWLVAAGLLLAAVALGIRNSPWARERYLSRLSTRSLSLLALERPNDPKVLHYLGTRLYADGDVQGSVQALQEAVRLDPRNTDAQLGLGVALANSGQPQAAERCFVRAAELRPKDARPYLLLARLYGEFRNTMTAVGPLKKATEIDPKNAEAWYQLGSALSELHQFDQALDALERAARLAPNQARYWRDLGELQIHFGRMDDARRSLEQARRLDPQDPGTLVVLARLTMTQAAGPPQLQTAEGMLQDAVRIQPKYAAAYRELGTLYVRQRKFPDAEAALRKAVQHDPTDGQALFQLGQALMRQGKLDEGRRMMKGFEALTEVRRSVSSLEDRIHQDPKNPELRLRIARLYRRYGADDRAVNQYQVYLSLKPGDAVVQKELAGYATELRRSSAVPARPANSP